MENMDVNSFETPKSARYDGLGDFFDNEKRPLLKEFRSEDDTKKSFCILFGGIRICYGNIKNIGSSSKQGTVQLRIALDCPDAFQLNQTSYKLDQQRYNLLYISSALSTGPTGENLTMHGVLTIDIQPDLFFRYCPPVKSAFERFRNCVEENKSAVLSPAGIPINNDIRSVALYIIHCNKPAHFRHIYLKAKVIELLTLQLEQFDYLRKVLQCNLPKEEDMQRMQCVKQILDDHFYLDHTLLSLARTVGTNDATLKSHFKKAFGTTIFSYLTSVRMQFAKELLMLGKEKIQVIAEKVGYKHATHFTAAFKKHFGHLPSKIRSIWVPLFMQLNTEAIDFEWML